MQLKLSFIYKIYILFHFKHKSRKTNDPFQKISLSEFYLIHNFNSVHTPIKSQTSRIRNTRLHKVGGFKNKRSQFSDVMTKKALEQLEIALNQGEQWAVETILKRTHAPLKAITPEHSIDGEFLKLKMKEISEFDTRIAALEKLTDGEIEERIKTLSSN